MGMAHDTRHMTQFRKVAQGIFLCVFISGCGYTTKSLLPANLKTIYVETFKNSISYASANRRNLYLPLLEVDARNAIINRFLFDGNLKIADADAADLVLKGELKGYNRSALRLTDNDDVEEYRVHVVVSLELWDTKKGVSLWTEPGFTGEATYFVTGSLASTETSAVNAAITDLARRIVERTIEDW